MAKPLKKAAPKKAAPKKAAPTKTTPKKAAPKKAAPTKAAPTKTAVPAVEGEARLSAYLVDGARVGEAELHLHVLPAVHVPSGQVAVGDPFAVRGAVLARRIRPGAYPVTLVVGAVGDDARALAAFVRLGHRPVARWERADAEGGDDAAYPVDAAAGAFADARAFAAMAEERVGFPTASFTALEHQLLDQHYAPAWGWASYQPSATSAGTCVAFLAGGADRCACWWGLDDRGGPTMLLTELGPGDG